MKVSVILKTNRTNEDTSYLEWTKKLEDEEFWKNPIFDQEFKEIARNAFKDTKSFIEPTIKTIIDQKYKNVELVIVHRHPELIKESVEKYSNQLDIKLLKEKHSVWHDLGDKYCTISNAINTGIIHAEGDMIVSTDDCTLYPPNLINEMIDIFNEKGCYSAPKGITFSIIEDGIYSTDMWIKRNVSGNILREESIWHLNPGGRWLTTYGYCFNVLLKDALAINGFDESLDGALVGDDGDFGDRLYLMTGIERIVTKTPIYMFGHKYTNVKDFKLVRDNKKFKEFIGQRPIPKKLIANTWRPTKQQCELYKRWHLKEYGSIDPNFDQCMNVKKFLLKEERRKIKKCV